MTKSAKKRKTGRNKKKKRISPKKIAGIIFLILLLFILIFLAAFILLETKGRKEMFGRKDEEVQMTVPDLEGQDVVLEDDGEVIIYNGKRYRYNENITSILCMGVDREAWNEEETGAFGQADMLMLAILDTESGTVKLWNISRDSMGEVDIYNLDGTYRTTETAQMCLAYAYSDGKEGSCTNTVRAVSRLLYGVPIQSYAAIDLDAIQSLNDAIGGVEVTIHEGDILPDKFVPGTTVLLQGDDAETYVRKRRTFEEDEPIDTNNNRMERQKQYMLKFIQKALQQTRQDITTPVKLFQLLMSDDNIITNITLSKVSYLATIFVNLDFSEESFETVPGEVVDGGKYAEYHVDDKALYEMILETFYSCEQ